jgi:tetratricopeptide (TPR) repeat protein
MLAMCTAETEHLVEAEGYYLRAIDVAREMGYNRVRYRALNNVAVGVYLSRGQFELALAALQEALRLAQDLGLDELLPHTLLALA